MIAATVAAVMLVFTNGGSSGRITTPAVAYFQTMKACELAKAALDASALGEGARAPIVVVCLYTGAKP